MKTTLAQIEMESPELKNFIFPARKQRPREARFMAYKNLVFVPIAIGMKRKAGSSPKKTAGKIVHYIA